MPYSVRTIASRSHGSIICEERKWYATTRRVLEKTFGRILVYSLYKERESLETSKKLKLEKLFQELDTFVADCIL